MRFMLPSYRNVFSIILMAGAVLFLLSTAGEVGRSLKAQDETDQDATQQDEQQRRSELGERQRLVERKMARLESMFESIAQKLQATEPERAKRLEDALQQAKENLIKKKMGDITLLLDQQKLAEAESEMEMVIDNLDSLIRLLLNEKDQSTTDEDKIKKLEEWKKQIEDLKKEEREQRQQTEKIANKDKTLDDLAQQAKAIKELIEKQKVVIDETEKNSDKGLQALDRVADRQFKVRKETEDLASKIGKNDEPSEGEAGENKPGESKPGESKPGESKPGEDKPGEDKPGDKPEESKSGESKSGESKSGESKSGEAKSGESKSGEAKSGESKSGESKSGESKSGEAKSGESKSGESKSGESKPGESKSGQSPPSPSTQPGSQPLQKAAEAQRKAEEKLGQGKAEEAKRSEQEALDHLNDALKEVEKEKKRIEFLPPEALKEMANKQRRTKEKTADVATEMKKSPKTGDDADPNAGQKQPGQQRVQNAQKAMENAENNLEENDPERAERQQRNAEKELDEALREIEERLEQLREETREEKLRRLEARFREMLARQQIASLVTSELNDKKSYLGRLRRRDTLSLLRLATEEREISELGQQAYDLLLEDGTSIVFPEMVQDVREDLERVAQLLEAEETGALTQMVQHQIEDTLEELLEALKKSQQQRESQSGGGGGGGGNQPLLRKSAELKMLRAAQVRVNRRTKQFDLIREGDKLETIMKQEVQAIADRQAEITEMTLRVLEKQ